MSEFFEVRRIVSTKKEKGTTQYLVDWAPSYADAESIRKEVLDDYKLYQNGVSIVGPFEQSTKKDKNNRNNWDWVVKL